MTTVAVGCIANRIVLGLSDHTGVHMTEMERAEALDVASRIIIAVTNLDAGVTVKRSAAEFMRMFEL